VIIAYCEVWWRNVQIYQFSRLDGVKWKRDRRKMKCEWSERNRWCCPNRRPVLSKLVTCLRAGIFLHLLQPEDIGCKFKKRPLTWADSAEGHSALHKSCALYASLGPPLVFEIIRRNCAKAQGLPLSLSLSLSLSIYIYILWRVWSNGVVARLPQVKHNFRC
jgi:hypothetical protein